MNNKQQEQKQVFDMTIFLAEAFSTTKKTYKLIDKIYNQDRIKFIKIAKENKYYNHKIAREGSIKQEYYFKKSLGVLLASAEDLELNKEIQNIIKKAWNYAYAYVNNHNNISTYVFINKLVKKHGDISKITDDEMNNNVLILIILSQFLKKELDRNDEMLIGYLESLQIRLEHYKKSNRININDITKEKKKELRDIELKLTQENKIFFSPSSHRMSSEQQKGMLVDIKKLTKEDKYFSAFEYVYDLENMSLISIVGENLLKSKEIQELIFCYTQFFDIDKIDYNELKKFLYPAIEMRYLCQQYKKSKEFFFSNFNEQLYEEINQKEIENREIKKDNLLLQDENERLKLELEKLKRENKNLKSELDKRENENTEVKALREFLFKLDDKEDIEIDNGTIDWDKLNQYKGVFIGGSPALQNKLKEKLDNWNFINVDNINFDTNILLNADKIFIYTNYLSHAMYYKVMNIVNKKQLEIAYIKAKSNIDIIGKELQFAIK